MQGANAGYLSASYVLRMQEDAVILKETGLAKTYHYTHHHTPHRHTPDSHSTAVRAWGPDNLLCVRADRQHDTAIGKLTGTRVSVPTESGRGCKVQIAL